MQDKLSFLELLGAYGAAGLAWLSGESGRIYIAGGSGGLVRWLSSDKRRIRDGVVSMVVGVIVGQYAWPIGFYIPKVIFDRDIPETTNMITMFALITGGFGMSAAKIVLASLHYKFSQKGV